MRIVIWHIFCVSIRNPFLFLLAQWSPCCVALDDSLNNIVLESRDTGSMCDEMDVTDLSSIVQAERRSSCGD